MQIRRRIFGGKEVSHRLYPFIVRLNATWSDSESLQCSGSIVSKYVIVTACQCIWKLVKGAVVHPKRTRIRAGIGDLTKHHKYEQYRSAKKYFVHPGCQYSKNEAIWVNDVGLIHINQPLHFNKEIKRLPVFSPDVTLAQGELKRLAERGVECTSPGWGTATEPNGKPLQDIKMELIPLDSCRNTLCKRNSSFCFDYAAYGKRLVCADSLIGSPCHGDTGGPLFCDGNVFGMVSTISQCHRSVPLIYTSISPILDLVNWGLDDSPHSTNSGAFKGKKRPNSNQRRNKKPKK